MYIGDRTIDHIRNVGMYLCGAEYVRPTMYVCTCKCMFVFVYVRMCSLMYSFIQCIPAKSI